MRTCFSSKCVPRKPCTTALNGSRVNTQESSRLDISCPDILNFQENTFPFSWRLLQILVFVWGVLSSQYLFVWGLQVLFRVIGQKSKFSKIIPEKSDFRGIRKYTRNNIEIQLFTGKSISWTKNKNSCYQSLGLVRQETRTKNSG